ncbi:MAG: SufS family cysteine desulfurase [Syntrophobacteraceae bacterium]
MVAKASGFPPSPRRNEIVPVDGPDVIRDPQLIARIANELYQEAPKFTREVENLTEDFAGNKNRMGWLPSSETDMRVETIPLERFPSVGLKQGSTLPPATSGVAAVPLEETGMAGMALEEAGTTDPLSRVVPDYCGQFLEIPPSSRVSFQFLEDLKEHYFLPKSPPSPGGALLPGVGAEPQSPPMYLEGTGYVPQKLLRGEFRLVELFDQGFLNPASPHYPKGYHDYYFLPELRGPSELASPPPPRHYGLFDVEAIRKDFPVLQQEVHGKPLAWLDNAATTQKPQAVIDAVSSFYEEYNSNIHRGAHELAARATDAYEDARKRVQEFIGAGSAQEIVFVRGTTEAINLVAQTFGRRFIGSGDEILVTEMEHHANIVPWQTLCEEIGAVLRVAPINDLGEVVLESYDDLIGPKTRLVAVTHVSNALGTVNPVEIMTRMAHAAGARVLVDGAQSIPHIPVNVQEMDCDFFVFSGHKLFGPTGIGALYGKKDLLESMPPWQGGGSMISDVTFEKTVYNTVPHKFEAGTGSIASAIGLGAAIDYLGRIGLPTAAQYEEQVLEYATKALSEIQGLRLIGTAPNKVSVLSFILEGISNEEVGKLLDKEGIAVRAGHHCAQPLLRRFGLESTVRPSIAFYNTFDEIDRLVAAIHEIKARVNGTDRYGPPRRA